MGIDEVGGRGKKDERFPGCRRELGDDKAEGHSLDLSGENDRDGGGRPGANLGRKGEAEAGELRGALESPCDSTSKFGDIDVEGRDLLEGEGDVGAGRWLTAAGGDGSGAVVTDDD
jgi:hypothetical protein